MLQSTQLEQLSLIQRNMGAVHVAVHLGIIKPQLNLVKHNMSNAAEYT